MAEALSILLVEDDPQLQALGKRVLRRLGYEPLLAKSGLEAVRMAAELAPALVMMDMALPDIDGLDATRRLKAAHPGLPIIAVTAHAFHQDSERAREAGCDAFITKPYKIQELGEMIRDVLGRQST